MSLSLSFVLPITPLAPLRRDRERRLGTSQVVGASVNGRQEKYRDGDGALFMKYLNVEQKIYLPCSQIPMNMENLYMVVCTRVCGQMLLRNVMNFQTIPSRIIMENLFHRLHQERSFVII